MLGTDAQQQSMLAAMQASLDLITDMVLWVNPEGEVVGCNQAGERFLVSRVERSPLSILGRPLHEVLPLYQAGQPLPVQAYPYLALLQGTYQTREYDLHWKQQVFTLEISGQCCISDRHTLAILIVRDLTALKQTNAEMDSYRQKEQEQIALLSLLQTTLECTADAILVVNRERNTPVYNQKFLQMWGIPEALMQPGQEDARLQFLAAKTTDPDRFVQRVWELFQDRPEETSLELLEFKDGRVIERYSCPQRRGDRVIGRVWSFRDITAVETAQAALRASETKFRALFENSQVGIFRSRVEDGLILDANQQFAELLGYASVQEVIGKVSATDFYLSLEIRQWVLKELQQHGELQNLEMQYRRSDGSLEWALYSLRLHSNDACIEGVVTSITTRKQAEVRLQQQQEFLRTVIDTNPSYIFVKDREGRYLLANKATADFYNATVEELLGKRDVDFHCHLEEVERFVDENRRVIETGEELFVPEERVTTTDRQDEWVQWQKRPLKLPGSEQLSVLGIGVNITERKHLEEELQRSRQFLNSIINTIPLAIFVKDVNREFRYVLINQSSEKILTFSREGALGLNDYDLISQERADYYRKRDLSVIEQGRIVEFPDEWVAVNEQESILIRGWKVPLFDAQNNVSHLLSIYEDVTAQRHREQALQLIVEGTAAKTGDEFFRACVRYLAEVLQVRYAIVTQLVNGQRDRVRILALWGIDCVDETIEYNLKDAPCEGVFQGTTCYYPQGLQSIFPDDADLVALEAESYLGIPLLDGSGDILGHLAVMDTRPMAPDPGRELILRIFAARTGAELERKRVEEALRITAEAAEAANRAKSAFLANMSHELRTPLNAILGFAQLMERDLALTPRQRESLSIINRSGEHLLDLINDVLEMSKIEAGRTVLNPAPFHLHHLLHTLRAMFQLRADVKQLALHFELAPDLPAYVLTDEGKLRQVLINLLSNAVKFTDQGNVTLRVGMERVEGPLTDNGNGRDLHSQGQSVPMNPLPLNPLPIRLWFAIADTGRGIAEQEMEHLFEPFVQTVAGTQMKEGTGLGLAISRQFIRLMDGDISLTSQVGQGTTFQFYIHAALADPAKILTPHYPGQVVGLAPGQPSYRILVADDRLENRELIQQLLQSVGFDTRSVANGAEAIAQWQSWHPHLIWMDMRMPVMDGYEATRRIRGHELQVMSDAVIDPTTPPFPASTSNTIIIALTASAFEEQRTQILAAGCNDFVRKPFKAQLIFDKMAEYLGVQYVYEREDVREGAKTAEVNQFPLQPVPIPTLHSADLAVMSQRWIKACHQAALAQDREQLLQLIEQIPEIHHELVDALSHLVQQSCFADIINLT